MKKVIVIAEAGVNHNGDFAIAKKLVDVAANAGADFVKFQTFKADKIVSQTARKAEYQVKNINDGDDSQYAMLKRLEMQEHWHHELLDYCGTRNIQFLSTGFDEESIDFLGKLNMPLFKIPSGEITNKPYLQHVASKGKPIILSTGMANLDEIREALVVLEKGGIARSQITVLHCNTEYPTPMQDVNLLAMKTIEKQLHVKIGYSDHTLGVEVPIAAVALGATVIEKHFTLDRNLPGPDHKASLEPIELVQMVAAIRNIELAISGSGHKVPSASEINNIPVVRRSIHYRTDKTKGNRLTADDLIMIRPGDGISPMDVNDFVGRVLKVDARALTKVNALDFE